VTTSEELRAPNSTLTKRLAELLAARYRLPLDRGDVLWDALMVCNDCDERMIDHDIVAMKCRLCPCDESGRGLSSYADDALLDLALAIRLVVPEERHEL
jgi:hypothetical protein